jgi:DNA-binding NtrC family response regulator
VVHVAVPALRERKDDIPALVRRFLCMHDPARRVEDLPPNAMQLFQSHDWPGNVRELKNTVSRLLVFPFLGRDAIEEAAAPISGDCINVDALRHLPLSDAREAALERFERGYLLAHLEEHGGRVARTAEAIGVSRQYLHRLITRYGIASER